MIPTAIVSTAERRSELMASVAAYRIVGAVMARDGMSRRDLLKQRCYRSVDARDRDWLMSELIRSGRLVLRDTRTQPGQPESIGLRYFAGESQG